MTRFYTPKAPWRLLALLLFLLRSHNEVSSVITDKESIFLKVPNAEDARQHLQYITSMPHVAGTSEDWIMANYVKDQFEQNGFDEVSIDPLDVYLNYPMDKAIVQLKDTTKGNQIVFNAKLSEDVLDFDSTSDTTWRNHTFHGYSPSGQVFAPLIYANYGRPEDFEALNRFDVSVKDKVVLVRYGKCFRGLKVMNAQKKGALAVLIYSDPIDDGEAVGPTYPLGPWRPPAGVQRGSVQFNSLCAGDPQRADARYRNAYEEDDQSVIERICGYNTTDLIPSIPSLPLSYSDAKPLIEALGGLNAADVFEAFHGGLNVTYRTGPSLLHVHVKVNNQGVIASVPNVIGKVKGTATEDDDQPVLLGNHRDAWVYGAADPNSGTAALLEVARGLGALLKKGWRPQRSIYLMSWSGEEYGLLGSTGWAELHSDEIRRAVAYLNVDTAVSGDYLSVSLTPSLSTLWKNVLDDLRPTTWGVCRNTPHGQIRDTNTDSIMNKQYPDEKILGSGSDYTVFLDHFGIASLDFAFHNQAGTYGQYHSIYDSFSWVEAFGGKDGEIGSSFKIMALVARIWGLIALRLANTDLLPLDPRVQGSALQQYIQTIQNRDNSLNLLTLKNAVQQYQEAAAELLVICNNDKYFSSDCNEKLGLVERKFLNRDGLPQRKWFRHILQAPGLFLGYSADAFPGIQQALDSNNLTQALEQIQIAAMQIQSASNFLSFEELKNATLK